VFLILLCVIGALDYFVRGVDNALILLALTASGSLGIGLLYGRVD
jgi:hypothetical protein